MASFRQNIRFARTDDGLRIAYATSGQGYPLIRAGTWQSNVEFDWRIAIFGPLFRELSKRYTLYRYDPRGYGLSEGGGGEVSLDTMVADLEAVAAEVKLEQFALWGGTSAGSLAAIAFAARHPRRVSHLVLSGPVARGRMHRTQQEKEAFLAFVKLVELGWGETNPAFRQLQSTQMFPRVTPEQLAELNELFRLAAPPQHAARMIMATGAADVSELLGKIACPTLVLHCRDALLMPIEEARLIASSVPDARFVSLNSENYLPVEGEPAFAQMIDEFHAFLPDERPSPEQSAITSLTRRERQVLELMASGLDNDGIAARLAISEKTIRNTVSHIFDKLAVRNRTQAVVLARKAGLGD